jgi:hypothetical protein
LLCEMLVYQMIRKFAIELQKKLVNYPMTKDDRIELFIKKTSVIVWLVWFFWPCFRSFNINIVAANTYNPANHEPNDE